MADRRRRGSPAVVILTNLIHQKGIGALINGAHFKVEPGRLGSFRSPPSTTVTVPVRRKEEPTATTTTTTTTTAADRFIGARSVIKVERGDESPLEKPGKKKTTTQLWPGTHRSVGKQRRNHENPHTHTHTHTHEPMIKDEK